jgi:hypothetical protein
MAEEGGPFLQAAFICEKVLTEADGTVSAIRIIDRFFITPGPGQLAAAAMPAVVMSHTLFVTFKSGTAHGRFTAKLVFRGPSGLKLQEVSVPVLLEGEERGANLIIPYQIQVDQEGLYWFDVYLNEKLMTKIPFRVIYQATTFTTPPQL